MTSVIKVDNIQNSSGTAALSIDSSGVITQPNKPMFAAVGAANTALASASWSKAIFNSETFDVGGYYDPTTNYRYTPLVAGKYFFTAQAYITYNSGTGPTIVGISFWKNGSNTLQMLRVSGTTNYGMVNVSGIFDMNGSSDYVETYLYQASATDAVYYANATNGIFTGYLIG